MSDPDISRFAADLRRLKADRTGGRKGKEGRNFGESLRKGVTGKTEHRGDKHQRTNFIQNNMSFFAYNRAFYRIWRKEIMARHRVVSVASDGRLLVLTR